MLLPKFDLIAAQDVGGKSGRPTSPINASKDDGDDKQRFPLEI